MAEEEAQETTEVPSRSTSIDESVSEGSSTGEDANDDEETSTGGLAASESESSDGNPRARGGMSALLPKADIRRIVEECLLLTQSGHSLDFAVQKAEPLWNNG